MPLDEDMLVYRVARVTKETANGICLCLIDNGSPGPEVWLPKSQIDWTPGGKKVGVPRWLALDKGLGKPLGTTGDGAFQDHYRDGHRAE